MKKSIQFQLSFMMFLEFFIWGGWFVTMGIFLTNTLSTDGTETAMAYSTQSLGAIVAPFFIGLIADRFFNAERIDLLIAHKLAPNRENTMIRCSFGRDSRLLDL